MSCKENITRRQLVSQPKEVHETELVYVQVGFLLQEKSVDLPAGTGVGGTFGGGYVNAAGGTPGTAENGGTPGGGYPAPGKGWGGGCCQPGAPASTEADSAHNFTLFSDL